MSKKTFWTVATVLLVVAAGLFAIAYWRDFHEMRGRLAHTNRRTHAMMHDFVRHVKGPWNPFAKKRTIYGAPFDAVRWRDSVPEVRVKGTWYELLALNDVPVEGIVRFCKARYGRIWRKRFEEDLTIALDEMEILEHLESENGTGSLTVRQLDSGETIVLTNVAWTGENRMAILRKALEVWIANGREKDPRDDPSFP